MAKGSRQLTPQNENRYHGRHKIGHHNRYFITDFGNRHSYMETQIKTAITAEMSTAASNIMTQSHVELNEETELITQYPTKTNEETHSTPIEVDADCRKRKVSNDTKKTTTTTNRITPTRNLRPQKHRELTGTPKKTLKEGKKSD